MNEETRAGLEPSLTIEGRVATITLRRPAYANRLNLADLAMLSAQLAQVNACQQVQVLRLQGQGKHFCSGFHLGQDNECIAVAAQSFEALANQLEHSRPVTIAVINGGVYGGATDLALACDLRIGTTAAEMFLPAAQLGLLFYRGGMERYVTRLGLHMARRVLLAVEKLDAKQMADCGFLDWTVAPQDLADAADALCTRLSGMAPLALLGMKRHLVAISHASVDAADLARDIARVNASSDLHEGALAWKEGRIPVFQGC